MVPHLEEDIHRCLRGLVGQVWADTLKEVRNLSHHIRALPQRVVVAVLGRAGRSLLQSRTVRQRIRMRLERTKHVIIVKQAYAVEKEPAHRDSDLR